MNALPTEPSRYISLHWPVFMTTRSLWYVVENGKHVGEGVSSLSEVLVLWSDNPPTTVYDEIEERFVPLVLGA